MRCSLEGGFARGGQKGNISFDFLRNIMIRGGGPKASDTVPAQLPFKTSFSLLIRQRWRRWRRCMAGWLAGWLGWLGYQVWLVGWVVGLAGLSGCRVGWVGWVGWVVGLSELAR